MSVDPLPSASGQQVSDPAEGNIGKLGCSAGASEKDTHESFPCEKVSSRAGLSPDPAVEGESPPTTAAWGQGESGRLLTLLAKLQAAAETREPTQPLAACVFAELQNWVKMAEVRVLGLMAVMTQTNQSVAQRDQILLSAVEMSFSGWS